jgi:WD40 repeat protein
MIAILIAERLRIPLMRHGKVIREPEPCAIDAGLKPGRVGHPRLRRWSLGRVALLLAVAISLSWLATFTGPASSLPMQRARGQSGAQVWGLALSPDGQTIATANHTELVTLRQAKRGWTIDRSLDTRGTALAFSPDGRSLLVGGLERDVIACDLLHDGRQRSLGIPVRQTSDLRFSPDGRTLAVSSYLSCEIILWDIEAGRERMTLRGHSSPVTAMAFVPDGRSLVSTGLMNGATLLWDLGTGQPRHRLIDPQGIALAVSPDSRLVAIVPANEKGVRIWDARTGDQVRSIAGHSARVLSVAFSPDGRLLATGAGDGTASLWNVATGGELRRLDGRADLLTHVAFSPDGRSLFATGNDDDIRVWDLDVPTLEMSEP